MNYRPIGLLLPRRLEATTMPAARSCTDCSPEVTGSQEISIAITHEKFRVNFGTSQVLKKTEKAFTNGSTLAA